LDEGKLPLASSFSREEKRKGKKGKFLADIDAT